MYSIFCSIHPPDQLSKEPGIIQKCADEFTKYFSYDEKILFVVANMFTLKRLKKINEKFNQRKPKKSRKSKRKKKKDESDDDSGSDDEIDHAQSVRSITTIARRM